MLYDFVLGLIYGQVVGLSAGFFDKELKLGPLLSVVGGFVEGFIKYLGATLASTLHSTYSLPVSLPYALYRVDDTPQLF